MQMLIIHQLLFNVFGQTDLLILFFLEISGKSKSGGVYKRQNVGIKEIVRDSHPAKKPNAICLASGDALKLSSSAEVRGGFEMASDHVTLTSALASVKGSDSGEAASKVRDHFIQTNVSAADTSITSEASVTMSVESVGKKQTGSSSISVGGFFTELLWYTVCSFLLLSALCDNFYIGNRYLYKGVSM